LLIYVLIVFFMGLLFIQILLGTTVQEGLTNQYQDYDVTNPNNALILAQKNAGNIAYLKERMDSIDITNQQQIIQDISGNVQALQTQVNGLAEAQQGYATQLTGGSAPTITGTMPEDEDESA
jgi:hypothetical protein